MSNEISNELLPSWGNTDVLTDAALNRMNAAIRTRAPINQPSFTGNAAFANDINVSGQITYSNLATNRAANNTVFAINKVGNTDRNRQAFRIAGVHANGDDVLIGAGALTIVGSGESAGALYAALPEVDRSNNIEEMHLTSDQSIRIHSNCQVITAKHTMVFDTSGNLNVPNMISGNSFRVSSDRRLKNNIKQFNPQKSILDLDIKEFIWKKSGEKSFGVIAQELRELFPELVSGSESENEYLSVEESKLIYPLILEVKKLRQEMNGLLNK